MFTYIIYISFPFRRVRVPWWKKLIQAFKLVNTIVWLQIIIIYCNNNRHSATSVVISIYCTSPIMYFVSCCFGDQKIALWNLNVSMNLVSYILVHQIPGPNRLFSCATVEDPICQTAKAS